MDKKILAVVFGLIAVTSALPPDVQMQFITSVLPKCASENGLQTAQVMAFASGNIEPTQQNKCFTKCSFMAFGLMDANGVVNVENDFINKLRASDAGEAQMYLDCVNSNGNSGGDPCDVAFNILQCVSGKM